MQTPLSKVIYMQDVAGGGNYNICTHNKTEWTSAD